MLPFHFQLTLGQTLLQDFIVTIGSDRRTIDKSARLSVDNLVILSVLFYGLKYASVALL